MTDIAVINQYLNTLSNKLEILPTEQRASIVKEIRAHLEARAEEGRLSEAIRGLGDPETCAHAYLEELSVINGKAGPSPTSVSIPGSFMTRIWGRLSTIVGFAVTGYLYLFTGVFLLCIIFEIMNPANSGMWLQGGTGDFNLHWGATSGVKYDLDSEILGFWYIPLNLMLVAGFFVLAEAAGRFSKRRVLNSW